MNQLPLAARAYATALALTALGLTIGLLAVGEPLSRSDIVLAAVCTGLVAVTTLRPLPLSFKWKLVLDTSVLIAAVLLFPAGIAMLIAAAGTLLAHAIRRDDWVQAAFNASQVALEVAAGELVLNAATPSFHRGTFDRPTTGVVILFAGAVMYVVSHLAVATMVALHSRMPVLDVWSRLVHQADRGEILGQFAQVGLGTAAAVAVTAAPWTLPLVLLPAAAVFVLLERHVKLRWEAEAALHAIDASLTRMERVGRLGRWEWDLTTGILVWSDETRRIFGEPPGSPPPTFATVLEAVHPADRASVDRTVHRAVADGTSFAIDHRIRLSDGQERTVHQEGTVVWDDEGRKIRVGGTIQDISERKVLEAQVEDISERHLAAADLADARGLLGASRETERLRLARELHDGPVQDLLAISYQLAGGNRAKRGVDGAARTALAPDVLRGEVLAVVRQLRGMIGELRPPGLQELGLVAALEGYLTSLRRQDGQSLPAISLDVDGLPSDLPEPTGLALFRVAQEAIRNAIRHADAREVCIDLRHQGPDIVLEVRDDGGGFAMPARLSEFARSGHFGFVGIAERVDHARGELTIESSIGAGTRVAVRLPLTTTDFADSGVDLNSAAP
jgi:signal transduction histidine kinase